jgi:hypothetical protein
MIDTVSKRFSIMDMDDGTMPAVPSPDGTIDVGDMYHLLWLYSGFVAAPPAADATRIESSMFYRAMQLRHYRSGRTNSRGR